MKRFDRVLEEKGRGAKALVAESKLIKKSIVFMVAMIC
jgi:hypothetical protein